MKIKSILVSIVTIILLFCMTLQANAYISTEQDLQNNIKKLQTLRNFNPGSIISKGDLIGYRLDDFNMAVNTYNTAITYSIDQLLQVQSDIAKFKTMSGITNSDRYAQIEKLYQQANTVMSGLESQTTTFVQNASKPMPTLTYERFKKKFWEYYYSLGL